MRKTHIGSRLQRPARQLKRLLTTKRYQTIIAFCCVGLIGFALLLASHALTPVASIEAENGTLSGNASKVSDSGASGGSAVKFSSAAATLHFAANSSSELSLADSLGFNLYDVAGSTSNPTAVNTTVNNLPTAGKALVWVGNLDNTNCTPGFSYAQFTAQVDALKGNSRVFGYYLSDEPHPAICPTGPSDIKARADYIHANAPTQKSFIVVLDGSNQCGTNLGCEYAALAPANTDVDLFGLDPYPCHYAADGVTPVACDNSLITSRVNSAIANGIPASQIVPTFQTFGQAGRTDGKTVYYRMPTTSELTSMLSTWQNLVPHPVFDYPYTFGSQCSPTSCVAPQAIDNDTTGIKTLIQTHNSQ